MGEKEERRVEKIEYITKNKDYNYEYQILEANNKSTASKDVRYLSPPLLGGDWDALILLRHDGYREYASELRTGDR